MQLQRGRFTAQTGDGGTIGPSTSSRTSSSSIGFCGAVCGDNIVMSPEQCDNGTRNSDAVPNACRTDCRRARCGDRVVDSGETCDDGNTQDGDDCPATCGRVTSSTSTSRSSTSSTSSQPNCGNGRRDTGEECDDGNLQKDDGCDDLCREEPGWKCEPTGSGSSSSGAGTSSGGGGLSAPGGGGSSSSGWSTSQSSDQSPSTGCPAESLCLNLSESIGACPGGADALPLQPYQLCGGGEASRACYRCPAGSSSSNILIQ